MGLSRYSVPFPVLQKVPFLSRFEAVLLCMTYFHKPRGRQERQVACFNHDYSDQNLAISGEFFIQTWTFYKKDMWPKDITNIWGLLGEAN